MRFVPGCDAAQWRRQVTLPEPVAAADQGGNSPDINFIVHRANPTSLFNGFSLFDLVKYLFQAAGYFERKQLNINYDIRPQNQDHLALNGPKLSTKRFSPPGKEYHAAALSLALRQIELTKRKVQFPSAAKSEDIAAWLREPQNITSSTNQRKSFQC